MSSPKGKRDVVRLRTFADDVQRAQNEQGISDAVVASTLPSETPSEGKGVFLKVKKKSLDLKDESAKPSALDTDGITFDEETTTQVTDKAYEEHKSIVADQRSAVTAKPAAGGVSQVQIPTVQPPLKKVALKADETINKISAPTASVLDTKDAVHDVSRGDMGGGEIVSDKKRERFKLIPAIGEAVTSWFDETKEQIEEARREKHTVTKTEDRVDTIKAAAQEKTFAPGEDFDVVAERLKQTKKVSTESTPVIVKPKVQEVARWTHTVPEAGEEAEATVDSTPASQVAQNVPQEIAPQASVAAAAVTTSAPTEPTPAATEPETVELTANLARLATPTPPPAQAATPTRSSFAVAEVSPTTSGKREFLPSPVLAIIVVVIAIVSGIGTSLYFFWQPEDAPVVAEPTTNPLFTAQLQTNVTFSESHSETMNTLLAAVNSNPNTLYMYFTRAEDQSLVASTDVMSFLAPQAPGSFVRSVTNLSFGAQDNRPFIVLRVNNFDNAFSGILAWERTMSADLAPLFGPVVTESFDPQARTDSQTRSAFFRDIIANNLSSRLLADEQGEDRIIYTFLDKQTILITTDRLQLSNIIPLIR